MDTQMENSRNESNGDGARAETVLTPAVDIFETDDGITLLADMPGVSRERLDLRVDGSNLQIEGSIRVDAQERMLAVSADVRSALYRRSFVLSNELETDKIDANLKDGLLTVRIPKRAELRPRRIEVRN
jgi:HSP20 family protein